jgi:ABC-type sugar transport system substrate-binding protein
MGEKLSRVTTGAGILVAAGVLVAGAIAGSDTAGTRSHPAGSYRIGLVLPDLSNLYIAGIRDGAQAQAKKSGATILVKGTNDAAGQTNALLAYVGAKVDAIVVDAIDGHAIAPAIKAANKANIPVVAIQSNVYGGKTATFIAGREDHAGVAMGTDAVNWCKNINPCKIGIVEGILADQSGAEENKAFRATVAKHSNIKIVGQAETQYDPAKALNVATNLLTANPDLNYIYAWWDPGGAASVKAIQAAGKLGKVGVASQNGDCIELGLVLKGSASVTAAFFPSIIGGTGVTSAIKAIKGEKLPGYIEAPVLGVSTKDANAWLAGTSSPPAALKADIIQRLKEAKSGHCPTK